MGDSVSIWTETIFPRMGMSEHDVKLEL
jgi:hypothetical protein